MQIVLSILLAAIALLLPVSSLAAFSRSDAERKILESERIKELAQTVRLRSQAASDGQKQGIWQLDRVGRISTLNSSAAAEIKKVSDFAVTPATKPSIGIKVTGMADSPMSDKIKEAKFSWAYESLTPLLRRFAVAGGEGLALFRLYDDGWRLENVEVRYSDKPIDLSAAERSNVDRDISRAASEMKQIQDFARSSWTPTRIIREYDFPAASASAGRKYGPVKLIITDVDISYGGKRRWFGHMQDIGVSPRGQIYLNNRNLVGAFLHEHPRMNAQEVVSVLLPAVQAWRMKYEGKLPRDVNELYEARSQPPSQTAPAANSSSTLPSTNWANSKTDDDIAKDWGSFGISSSQIVGNWRSSAGFCLNVQDGGKPGHFVLNFSDCRSIDSRNSRNALARRSGELRQLATAGGNIVVHLDSSKSIRANFPFPLDGSGETFLEHFSKSSERP